VARIRTIKPEFPQSETVGRVSRDARLLFIQLWTVADDSGRTRGNSRVLASLLYPYDDDARGLMDAWLNELEAVGAIRRYVVDGETFLDIPNWLKHQKIDRPSASKYPGFDEASRVFASPRELSPPDLEGKGREGKGGEGSGQRASARDETQQPRLEVTPAVRACILLREGGHMAGNPAHPGLIAAVNDGLTPEELRAAADEFPGKPLAYWIKTAEGRRRDAAATRVALPPATAPVQRWTPPDDDPEYTRASA
jgi:hypothetical protein